MNYCEKCGKEITNEKIVCPNCGYAVLNSNSEASYDKTVQSSGVFLSIGIALMALGALIGLFVNYWIGAALLLAAELIFLIPNTKIQNAVKRHNPQITDKKQLKAEIKKVTNEIAAKKLSIKIMKILAVISLILLTILVLLGNAMGI